MGAATGPEALALAERVMPGMNGDEVALLLLAVRP
jgi:hypothetical protein